MSANSLSIAVRVFDRVGNGGIYGAASMMRVHPAGNDAAAVSLAGAWKYRVELRLEPKGWTPPPDTSDSPSAPERLWNGMLRPLAPYARCAARSGIKVNPMPIAPSSTAS